MDVCLHGPAPTRSIDAARARFESRFDLERPVDIEVRDDPAERIRTSHADGRHRLVLPESATRSAIATELLVHEFAHMRRAEEHHPSHTVDSTEAFVLAAADRRLESDLLAHAYQIANHVRDIYADDITFAVTDGEKVASLLESQLAMAIDDSPRETPVGGDRRSAEADPALTAVNAAFALALLDRHGIDSRHQLAALAHAAQADAPVVDLERFRRRFRDLGPPPNETECLRTLVDLLETYFETKERGRPSGDAVASYRTRPGGTDSPEIEAWEKNTDPCV